MSSAPKHGPGKPARDSFQNLWATVDGVVRRLIGSGDPEYEDLVQTCLVSVLATLDRGQFRGECPSGGWAAIIARNVAVDAIRARIRDRKVFAAESWDGDFCEQLSLADTALGPEGLIDAHRTLDRVNRALAGLGPNKARVVYLHDILGYQLAEVAAITGTSIAAAQSRLVRGRREIVFSVDPDSGSPKPRGGTAKPACRDLRPQPRGRRAADL